MEKLRDAVVWPYAKSPCEAELAQITDIDIGRRIAELVISTHKDNTTNELERLTISVVDHDHPDLDKLGAWAIYFPSEKLATKICATKALEELAPYIEHLKNPQTKNTTNWMSLSATIESNTNIRPRSY